MSTEHAHVVMVSGGVGSFAALDMVCQVEGPQSVIALFADTRMEDDDLYRFLAESTAYTGAKLIELADGRDPWQVFVDVGYIGNSRVDPCSMHLKRNLCDRWLAERFTPATATLYVGIDYTEAHRIERLAERKRPWVYRAPMVERGLMLTNADKVTYCRERGIEPPRLTLMGWPHNNCGGFCVKAGLAQFKALYEQIPERYDYHVRREREARDLLPSGRPFLRKVENGVLRYLWLEEYRDELAAGSQLSMLDAQEWGGCGCALD